MKSSRSQRQKMTSGELFLLSIQTNIYYITSVIVLVFAVLWLYPDSPNVSLLQSLDTISRGYGSQTEPRESLKIAIGWNTNVDVIVNGVDIMRQLSQQTTTPFTSTNHATLESIDEVLETFTYFFETSSAAERHVDSAAVFDEILRVAQLEETVTYRTGGNAALMAETFASLGHEPVLHGPIGPALRKLLHENITLIEKSSESVDEMHLILEFASGSEWNGKQASRANRFILTRDIQNAKLSGMHELHQTVISSIDVDAVVISGFHLLHSQELSREEEHATLTRAQSQLQELSGIPIHLECASIARVELIQKIAQMIFPLVDSIGLNEQECMALYEALGGGYADVGFTRKDLVGDVPRPDALTKVVMFILKHVRKSSTSPPRLERIHIHTFAFHMIATVENKKESVRASTWRYSDASVAKGSVMATLTSCDTTLSTVAEHELRIVAPSSFTIEEKDIEINEVEPVGKWKQTLTDDTEVEFYYAPVMTCVQPRRTVGLGDSISSSALIPSLQKVSVTENEPVR